MGVEADVGLRVRQLRLERGMSQETLGAVAGLDRTYVSGLERGKRNPSLRTLARIAEGLGVTPAELLRRAGEG